MQMNTNKPQSSIRDVVQRTGVLEIVGDMIREYFEIVDYGTDNEKVDDYPDYCLPAAESVAKGESNCGIVFGGSDNGETMVANKVERIRCGLCWNVESARLTKEHNNANMISIGGRMVSLSEGTCT